MLKYLIKFKNKIRYELNRFFQPQMVMGYRRYDGIKLVNTRISNTTYLGDREKLYLEDHVFIGHYNVIDASNGVIIKEGCQITNFVSILTHSSHISIRLYGEEYQNFADLAGYITGEVILGEFSFIGPHCVIMPGTKIGRGVLVSAYSYVKGQFPDFSIIAGNPATVVGDTRKLDREYLKDTPELKKFYRAWSKEAGQ